MDKCKLNVLVFLVFLVFSSCKGEKKPTLKKVNDFVLSNIEGETFLRVTEIENRLVLFQPCDANIATFKFYKDSIFHNWGQEYYSYNSKLIKKQDDYLVFETRYKYNGEVPETSDSIIKIEIFDNDRKIWKINDELYIENNFKNLIPFLKENCSTDYEINSKVLSNNEDNIIAEKWFGLYQMELNLDKDWQEQQTISLLINKDSIIYEETGHQLYNVFLLSSNEQDSNKLILYYKKTLEGLKSDILVENKEFGILTYDGKVHKWLCPHIDKNTSNVFKKK